MTDEKIIELLFARDERALRAIEEKYKSLCRYTAGNFLNSTEDIEECINDVLLSLWEHIPPERPENLPAYITVLVRNEAKRRTRDANAWKRGGQVQIVGEEFLSIIPDGGDLTSQYESRRAGEVINAFLAGLSKSERRVFMMRYWIDAGIDQIAAQTGFSHSKIKSMLARLRKRLSEELRKEGIFYEYSNGKQQ